MEDAVHHVSTPQNTREWRAFDLKLFLGLRSSDKPREGDNQEEGRHGHERNEIKRTCYLKQGLSSNSAKEARSELISHSLGPKGAYLLSGPSDSPCLNIRE